MRSMTARATAIAALAVLVVAGLVAAVSGSPPVSPRVTRSFAAPAAPSGQRTASQPIRAGASRFRHGAGGWSSAGATASWARTVGHRRPGALAVTSSASRAWVRSPGFPVHPGVRYSAALWTQAKHGAHGISIGLRFYRSDGSTIPGSTVVAEPVQDPAGAWTRTRRVIGFAPADAATGAVLAVSGTDGRHLDYVDDVFVWKTTGYAAPIVGPLHTSGRDVLDADDRRVQLHGIQLGGMRNANWSDATVSTTEIDAAQRWGANFVRLPLAENPAVPKDCSYDARYLAIVDRIVHDVTSRGMVILLDLHTNAVTDCGDYAQQQKLPDAKAVTFWQVVANRYKRNPLVAFDLFNEPHDVGDFTWRNGGRVTSGGATYMAVGMQKLYNTVRATGADNLVFASGNNWANRYPAGAPLTRTSNLVWGVHAYTCHVDGQPCSPGPGGVMDPAGILRNFAFIGRTQPVMVTEFGFPDGDTGGEYIRNVADWAAKYQWVGWNVFVFDGTAVNPFDLLQDVRDLWDPEPAGMAVMLGMLHD